jgi:hypothetical protein
MMKLPGLSLIERLAMWVLVKSPRTSLVAIKQIDWPMVFVAANTRDAQLQPTEENETESMRLERIYHQPSAGEAE